MASIKINRDALNSAISNHFSKENVRVTPFARELARERFQEIKTNVLRQFDQHDVTKEILRGPRGSSTFLSVGNLFSFLGFYADATPAQDLRDYIDEGLRMNHIPTYNGRIKRYYFKVTYRDQNDLESLTRGDLPWDDRSWIKFIEEGVDNLNHYLYSRTKDFPQSFSGPAIQIKAEVPSNSGGFGGVTYIKELIEYIRENV